MNITLLAESSLPLGINFFEILLHMFNLAILIVGMRFLIYKPVKKFMKNRSEEYKKAEDESEQKRKDAEELKKRYEKAEEEARQNAIIASREAAASAQIQADEIIQTARTEAAEILKKADEELYNKELMHKEKLSGSVAELAYDVAQKILQRELKPSDNDAVIDNIINRWNK